MCIGQVISYDLLESGQLFTHRMGRTGHMGRSEVVVTFITSYETRKRREIGRLLGTGCQQTMAGCQR